MNHNFQCSRPGVFIPIQEQSVISEAGPQRAARQQLARKRTVNALARLSLGVQARWAKLHQVSPFGSDVLLTIGTNGWLALMALLTGPMVARMLGPTGRGELAAIQNLFWVIATLAMLGLPEATLYFTARQPLSGGRVLGTSIALMFLTAPVLYLGMYFLVPLLLASESANTVLIARWCLLCIPLYALMVIPTFAVRGRNDLVRWNILRILPGFGWLLFLLSVWLMATPTVGLLARGYLFVLALLLLPTAVAVRKLIPGPYWPRRLLCKPMLKYGVPQSCATVPQILNLRLDQLLIAALLPPRLLGLYVVAVAWGGATGPVLNAIGNVLFPRIAGARSTPGEIGRALAQVVRWSMMIGCLLAFALGVLAPVAIPLLFGNAFAPAVPVSLVLVLVAFISGMNVILEEGLRGLGDTAGVFWSEISGLLVTVSGLVLLLRPLEIMGAGIASVMGQLAIAGVLVARTRRNTGVRMRSFLLPGREDFRLLSGRLREYWSNSRGALETASNDTSLGY